MGIPGFSLWFADKNKQAFVPLNTVTVDHVYIDLNSVLHTVLRRGARAGAPHAGAPPPPHAAPPLACCPAPRMRADPSPPLPSPRPPAPPSPIRSLQL
jgi:hypothetical protein